MDLYVIANEDNSDEQLKSTLVKYEELSSDIQVTYVDPAVSPNFYQNYTTEQISANSVIAVCGERSKVIDYSDLYETSVDYQTYSQQTTGYDGEGQLTSAIQYVTNQEMQAIYEITGHDELPVSGRFLEAIEKMNLQLQQLNLLETDTIPQDCEAVIIHGPQSDFSKDDADKMIQYLADGGKVLITTQYTTEPMTNFKRILEEYDLQLQDGMVVEANEANYYQNPLFLLPDISYDTVTAEISDEYVFLPYAQGLLPTQEDQDTISYTKLLGTSDQAFLKTDVRNMMSLEKEDGDEQGPFTLGISVADTASQAQLFVYTSANLFTDEADQSVSGNNAALFAASIRSLVGEADTGNLIVIPVKPYTLESITIAQGTILLTGFFSVLFFPVLLVVCGIVIWLRRRKA